ncbi:cell wall-binding repeat-containing protein [Leucobacter sp. OLTLW20]|uniref:cell wall-binding repeat-containing protein n=1 Tax=Leucobacter sp. OLTLW20 TaxID=1914916 RepID=UPI000C185583|nr:cell wall-binding repeat-containing protein [Leucobacter sp. OLTLW20]PII89281.1 hypothetical protein BMH26_03510 [Leucobacter sp. OLTLW20]
MLRSARTAIAAVLVGAALLSPIATAADPALANEPWLPQIPTDSAPAGTEPGPGAPQPQRIAAAGVPSRVENARLARKALTYVGKPGNVACREAGLTLSDWAGGQCKQFVNCVSILVFGKNPAPGYQAGFAKEGIEVAGGPGVVMGDIIQVGDSDGAWPLHTAIVVRNLGGGRYDVVDSNAAGSDVTVSRHEWVPPAGSRFWRLGTPAPDPQGPQASRLAGLDRYETSAAVSRGTFPAGAPVAYVANGLDFPDALSGSAAAGTGQGPVLLVRPGSIPTAIAGELQRLKPQRIVVLGGTGVVSSTVETQLKSYTAGAVSRLSGADRFGTSAAVSRATFAQGASVAYIANGLDFPDSLPAGGVAGTNGGPLLMVRPDSVPGEIAAELERLKPSRIVVVGGTAVVTPAVQAQVQAYTAGPVTRAAGSDRFATSTALSQTEYAPGVPVVYLASGLDFPDALSGAAAAGARRGPVLYVRPDSIPLAVQSELGRLAPRQVVVLGGTGVFSQDVQSQLGAYVVP